MVASLVSLSILWSLVLGQKFYISHAIEVFTCCCSYTMLFRWRGKIIKDGNIFKIPCCLAHSIGKVQGGIYAILDGYTPEGINMLKLSSALFILHLQACQLPFFECSCCYERAWYAKLGGCIAIKFMMDRMDTCWVHSHLYQFLKALLFVMMDLTGEVSDLGKSSIQSRHPYSVTPTVALWESLVCQTWWMHCHQIHDGSYEYILGTFSSLPVPQGFTLCYDGSNWRGK